MSDGVLQFVMSEMPIEPRATARLVNFASAGVEPRIMYRTIIPKVLKQKPFLRILIC
jgi:hypothetical protein